MYAFGAFAMPQQVSIKELRAHLAEYLALAQQGQEVVVTNHGRAMARLSPVNTERVPGVLKGRISQQPEDAWEFPEGITAIMEGEVDE
jgi:prevent-host-death family protein